MFKPSFRFFRRGSLIPVGMLTVFSFSLPAAYGESDRGDRIVLALGSDNSQANGEPSMFVIPLNDDDDNHSGFPDMNEGLAGEQEDDLIELQLSGRAAHSNLVAILSVKPYGTVRIWTCRGKGKRNLLELPAAWPYERDGMPALLYVEGIAPSRHLSDTELRVEVSSDDFAMAAQNVTVASVRFEEGAVIGFARLLRDVSQEDAMRLARILKGEEPFGLTVGMPVSPFQAVILPKDAAPMTTFDIEDPAIANVSPDRAAKGQQPFIVTGMTEGGTALSARVAGRECARLPLAVVKETWILSYRIVEKEDRSAEQRLMAIVRSGKSREVRQMIKDGGIDFAKMSESGLFPVHEAVRRGQADMMKTLARGGADVNGRDGEGVTPLQLSLLSGKSHMARVLIDEGADVKAAHKQGKTPLHLAIEHVSDLRVIRLMIAKGACVNARDDEGATPLHRAIVCDRQAVALAMIGKDCDVNASMTFGARPLYLAAQRGWPDVVAKLLTAGADPLALSVGDFNALEIAALARQDKAVRLLRQWIDRQNADIHSQF
jgi:ankyrin repeat protein